MIGFLSRRSTVTRGETRLPLKVSPGSEKPRFGRLITATLSLSLLALPVPQAHAQNVYTWDGGGINNNLGSANNWNPNGTPTFDSNAILVFQGTTRTTVNNETARTVNQLSLNATGFTIGGQQFSLDGTNAGISLSTGTGTISAALSLLTDITANVTGGNLTVSGVISGSSKITKIGNGTLTLSASNTFSGEFDLNAGVLIVGNSGALSDTSIVGIGGGTLTFATGITTASIGALQGSGGTINLKNADNNAVALTINQASDRSFAGSIVGPGSITKSGNGNLTITGSLSYVGGTTVSAGTLQIGDGGTAGSITGDVTISSGATFAYDRSDDVAYSGNTSDAGSFLKLGAGTLTITGNLGQTGGTTITAGTLQIGSGGASGSLGGDVSVSSGATLTFDRSDNIGFIGAISGAGNVTQSGSGNLVLSGSNSFTGTLTLNSGVLTVANTGAISTASAVTVNGGTLALGSGIAGTSIGTLSGNGGAIDLTNLDNNGVALTVNQAGDGTFGGTIIGGGSLNKAGAGTLTATGDWDYSGGTVVSAGTLQVGDGGTNGSLGGAVMIAQGANLTFNRSDNTGYGGNTFGDGSLTKAGAGTLLITGNLGHTGGTSVSAGTLLIGGGGTIGSLGGDVVISDGASLTFNRSDNTAYSGDTSGAGSFTRAGTGVLVITGNLAHTGGTTVDAGTLQIGDGGTVGSLSGDASISAGAMLVFNRSDNVTYSGNVSGNGSFAQNGSGTLTLTGSLGPAGGTTVNAGTLQIGNGGASGSLSGDVSVASGATLSFNRSGFVFYSGNVSGAGSVVQSGSGFLGVTGDLTQTGGTSVLKGTFNIGNDGTSGSVSGDIFVDAFASLQFERSDTLTYAGNITGTGLVQQMGLGTLILTGSLNDDVLISGGTLQIGDGGADGTLAGGAQIGTATGKLVFDRSDDYVYTGSTSGSGTMFQNGTGTLIVTGSLNNTGAVNNFIGVTVNAGTLQVGDGGTSGSLGGNVSVASGATLACDRSDDVTYSGNVSGAGNVTQAGAGTLTLSGSNSFTGTLTMNWGSLTVGNANAISTASNVTVNSGTLDFGSGITTNTINNLSGTGGMISLTNADNNGVALTVNQTSDGTFAGNISGSGSLTKSGSGTLTITSDLSHTGGTTISAGTLQIGNGGTSGSLSGDVSVASGATLTFDRSDDITFNDVISGAGNVTQNGTGDLTISGNNTFTGTLTIDSGTLTAGNANAISTASNVVLNGGTLNFATLDPFDVSHYSINTLSGTGGTIDLSGGHYGVILTVNQATDQTFNGTISRNGTTGARDFIKSGSGTLTLTTHVSINGFEIGQGKVVLNDGQLLAGVTETTIDAAGELDFGSGVTSATLTNLGEDSNGHGTLNTTNLDGNAVAVTNNESFTSYFTANVVGSGSFTKTGSGETDIIGTLEQTGGTFVNQGTLQLGFAAVGNGAEGSIVGDVSVASGASLGFYRFKSSLDYSGAISGAGSLYTQGNGTVTLSGNNSFTGTLAIKGDTLIVGSANAISTASAVTMDTGFQGTGTLAFGSGITTNSINNLSGSAGTISLTNADNNGVALTVNETSAHDFSGNIIGKGSLTKAGNGTLIVDSNLTYTGGTAVNAGILDITNSGSLSGDASVASGATLELDVTHGNVKTYGGNVFGAGSLLVENGTLIVTGDLTHTGATSVTGVGTLQIGNGGTSGSITGDVFLPGHSTLDFDRSDDLTYGGNTFSNGSLVKDGAGTLTITGSLGHTNGTTVNAGTLQIGNGGTAGSLSGNASVASGATLAFNRSNSVTYGGAIANQGTINQAGSGSLTLTGAITQTGGTIQKSGSGALAFGSGASVTGGTINADSTVSGAASFTDVAISQGKTITQNASASLTSSTLAGTWNANAALTANNLTITSTGILNISSGGTLTVNGLVDQGTLNNNGSSPLVVQGSSSVSSGSVLSSAVEVSGGKFANNGTVTGTVTADSGATIKGTGDYAGGYILNGGSKIVFGNSPGLLTSGSATWNAGAISTFQIDHADGAFGVNWGANQIDGTLTLDGSHTNPFTIDVESVLFGSGNTEGPLTNFSSALPYSWEWVRTTAGIFGYDHSDFRFDTSLFAADNNMNGGQFDIQRQGNSLFITFAPNGQSVAPEPGSLAFLMLPFIGVIAWRRRNMV